MRCNGLARGVAVAVSRGATVVLLALAGSGCGGGSSSPDGGAVVVHPPWAELPQPALSVQGGTAFSPGGQGQAGGVVHLVAQGDVTMDPMLAAPVTPVIPAAPAEATKVDAAALAADVDMAATVVVAGDVTTGGGEAIRRIATSGDLFVTGKLRAADLGAGRQGLELQAGGTIYVSGTVDVSGASGTGQAGGALHLSATQIVVTGKLLTSGGSGVSGGAAGAVTLTSTQAITFSGAIESFGGNGTDGSAVAGGTGGALTVTAGGDLTLAGAVLVRGGAAAAASGGSATGGAAAVVTIDANGAVTFAGSIDARGGLAKAGGPGGAITGGAAGAIRVGETAPPTAIAISVPVDATGGAGDAGGGAGGTVTSEPGTGSINVNGPRAIDVSGGDSLAAPGAGGAVNGSPRTDPGSGGFHVVGEIVANGGSVTSGGNGNGAEGGHVDIELTSTDGAIMIDETGKISAEGGKAVGSGTAGGGGHVWMFTKDGDLTVAGTVSVRGGAASDGTGGLGGMIYLFSDNNHNAVDLGKGNLLIAPTGKLDASGGDGAIGGNARSDGIPGFVPVFPDDQEKIAIFLNCDGAHGETYNWMQNAGALIARGGVHNGSGGDIVYHGIGPGQRGMDTTDGTGNHHPPSGNVDMAGDGTGQPGDYGGE